MDFPTSCRKCSNEIGSGYSLYHSPHFDVYFEKGSVTDKLDIPLKSIVVYCQGCAFDIFRSMFFFKYSKCESCGVLSRNQKKCAKCRDKLLINISQSPKYKQRTCVKCNFTQTPLSKQGIKKCRVSTYEGFPCGEWTECNGKIGRINGYYGEYELKNEVNGFVCKGCFSEMEHEVRLPVVCDLCSVRHASVNRALDQGYQCASYLTDGAITCSFGSGFDSNYYKWTQMLRPEKYRTCRLACDDCISKLVNENVIYLESDF